MQTSMKHTGTGTGIDKNKATVLYILPVVQLYRRNNITVRYCTVQYSTVDSINQQRMQVMIVIVCYSTVILDWVRYYCDAEIVSRTVCLFGRYYNIVVIVIWESNGTSELDTLMFLVWIDIIAN